MEKIVDYFFKFDAILVFSVLTFLLFLFVVFFIFHLDDEISDLKSKLNLDSKIIDKRRELSNIENEILFLNNDLKELEDKYISKLSSYHSLCDYIEIEKKINKNKSKGGKKK